MSDRIIRIRVDLIDGFRVFELPWDYEDFYPPYAFDSGCLIISLSPSETDYYPFNRIREVKVIHENPKY